MSTERKDDQPNLELVCEETGTKKQVFALKEGEWLDMLTSSKPGHHRATGPALVYREISPQGTTTDENHVDDGVVWNWIGMLIHHGAAHFGMRVTTPIQGGQE